MAAAASDSELFEHRAKLAELERARPTAPRASLLQDELAQGIAYTLLAEQGADAHLEPARQERPMADGHGVDFVIKVIEHIERLRDEGGIKISTRKLARHVRSAGGEPNAWNMTRAQPFYLHALGCALLDAAHRYSSGSKSELDFAELIKEVEDKVTGAADSGIAIDVAMVPPANQQDARRPVSLKKQSPARLTSSIGLLGQELANKRREDNEWDDKTGRQAAFIFGLFARFMREVHGIDDLCSVKQSHLADFDRFLRSLHSNFGKSTHDPNRTIDEIRAASVTEVPKHGVLQGATRNRHLTFLGQLIVFGTGQGLAVGTELSTTPFRARKSKRGRDQRAVPTQAQLLRLFNQPVFIGYAGWDEIDAPGPEFYHRAEYFCSLIGFYEGARQEEYCGLAVEDVITDNGSTPYIHIAHNDFHRIKNL